MLDARELTGGNGMVEMGTFVAILLGQVAGGLLDRRTAHRPYVGGGGLRAACAGGAWCGAGDSAHRPPPIRTCGSTGIPVSETWRNLKLAHGNLVVFRSLLGISWMWFFGAIFLSQFPSFAKEVLHGDEQVASLLLVVFSVGIGAGSLLCETLSASAGRDRPGAARRDRHERVRDRPVLRLACAARASATWGWAVSCASARTGA